MFGGRLRALKVVVDLYLRWKKYLIQKKYLTSKGEYCLSLKVKNVIKYLGWPDSSLVTLKQAKYREASGVFVFREIFKTNAESVG